MSTETVKPLYTSDYNLPEITLKAVVLAIIITALLAASNVYLALKIGNTISASIPAAVLAMGILRFFRKSNALETNIIQTAASAGEGLAAATAFVMPALIILHFWEHFDYWSTVAIAAVGGSLGVLFSIPLRRIMFAQKSLRFPEGTAIGNVLRASAKSDTKLKQMILGGVVGGAIGFMQTGFKLMADNFQAWFVSGRSIFGMGFGFSPALLAAGYIVGPQVGITMLLGAIIGWVIGMPILSQMYGIPLGSSVFDSASTLWNHHIRFIGVGTMLLGGLWTLISLMKPIFSGVKASIKIGKSIKETGEKLPRVEHDMPIQYVFWGILFLSIVAFFLLHILFKQTAGSLSHPFILGLSIFAVIYIIVGGFFLASICGYFAGLVGSTNNPLSGIMLGSVLLVSLILLPVFELNFNFSTPASRLPAVAIVILITALVGCIATISNENLQDLKAGQMIGATPWKQQTMLVIGVIISALTVEPVLELLYQAYGIGGVFPRAGMDPAQTLIAPQAGLISAVASGVFAHSLPWGNIVTGIIIAIFAIAIDEYAKKRDMRLSVLALGLGIYLPPSITTPLFIGGMICLFANRHIRAQLKQYKDHPRKTDEIYSHRDQGTLLACGLVAGTSLMGVILAIPFVVKGSSDALNIAPKNFDTIAVILSVIATIALCVWIYKVTCKKV